jgi:hypothetical protein
MKSGFLITALASASLVSSAISVSQVIDDIDVISQFWGQITPYNDNKPNYFGVEKVGLPDGCGIEQVHVLHRCVFRSRSERIFLTHCGVGMQRDTVSSTKFCRPTKNDWFSCSATSRIEDGGFMETFVGKVENFTAANPDAVFKGPLGFLKSWTYQIGKGPLEGLPTALGSSTEFTAGVRLAPV